ncbi:MAG: Holliday junction resolvase RuvX [Alistipes sp.]|nr:Holliday junction resolvase RuvX [Alistipes sp.]
MGRILAIDYGRVRTGLAVSDPLQMIAGGLATVPTKELERFIAEYMSREEVTTIVLGKPMQMNGEPSETWRFIEPLARRLQAAHPTVEVTFYDERFTSVLAHRAMIDGGMKRMARRDKAVVDKIAATIILEDFLQFRR